MGRGEADAGAGMGWVQAAAEAAVAGLSRQIQTQFEHARLARPVPWCSVCDTGGRVQPGEVSPQPSTESGIATIPLPIHD